MARQDISVNASYGEVEMTDHLTNKIIHSFENLGYLEGMDNDTYCYGQVIVSSDFRKKVSDSSGFHIHVPYYPIYKEVRLRFLIEHNNGSYEYLVNSVNNSEWFLICRDFDVATKQPIKLSDFRLLNDAGYYNMLFNDGYLVIYSGNETDFMINSALHQNETFLLKAFAGSLYQYPTTGVGLIDFLHGNFENTGLAQKLQQEFSNDKMIIQNAYMDSNTGELLLDVKEKNG